MRALAGSTARLSQCTSPSSSFERCCRARISLPPSRVARRRWQAAAAAAADEGLGESADAPGPVLGIDLGTTNSCAALVEGGEPVVVPNPEGALTTPSVVAFTADGGVLVGAPAKRQAAVNPNNTFYSVKRIIGKQYAAVEQDVGQLSYRVVDDGYGVAVLECQQVAATVAAKLAAAEQAEGGEEEGADAAAEDEWRGQGQLYPEEVSGYVVQKLMAAAEEFAGRPISKAVISVPAYFTDAQREATITAGSVAGLEQIRIIREPVAAALAYGLDAEEDQTVLVFDLGGGTFDVSLLEVGGGVIEVLSTGGDAHLGGDDWDAAIMDWLIKEHLKPARVDCRDPRLLANLRGVAEAAKIKLSTEERVVIRMPVGGGIEAALTRQMFESMTKHLFRKARLPLDQACWQAGVDLGTVVKEYDDAVRAVKKGAASKAGGKRGAARTAKGQAAKELAEGGVQIRPKRRMPVGKVLLVGGATRMPAIRRFVRNMTGLDPAEFVVDPDLAVALGAAVQAGIYEGQVSDLMVMDVWQASLMRAFAQQQLAQEQGEQAEQDDDDAWEDEDEEGWEEEVELDPSDPLIGTLEALQAAQQQGPQGGGGAPAAGAAVQDAFAMGFMQTMGALMAQQVPQAGGNAPAADPLARALEALQAAQQGGAGAAAGAAEDPAAPLIRAFEAMQAAQQQGGAGAAAAAEEPQQEQKKPRRRRKGSTSEETLEEGVQQQQQQQQREQKKPRRRRSKGSNSETQEEEVQQQAQEQKKPRQRRRKSSTSDEMQEEEGQQHEQHEKTPQRRRRKGSTSEPGSEPASE
ncbi:hypothetical protein ABPG75_012663 [Micractinium tetrahymenae]